MRVTKSFDDAPLIAARRVCPKGTPDAKIIGIALAQLAGVDKPTEAHERMIAGAKMGAKKRAEQLRGKSALNPAGRNGKNHSASDA